MWRTLFVAALLVVAGCATQPPGGGTDAEGSGDRQALTSGGATTNPNPWGQRELTVAINNTANESRNFRPLVARALDFWANNSTRYVGFPVEFVLDSNASEPDLVVEFVDSIDSCANVTDPVGCAPYVTRDVSRPVTIEVVGSYDDESTLLVLKHELGHALGLNHTAEPQSVMAPSSQLSTLPEPNATERRLPWDDANFTVFVDANATANPDAVRAQVRYALDYYASGANGTVPSNVSFAFVDNRSRADVVIEVGADELPCQADARGSCGRAHGPDPDGDDALETYDRLRVTVGSVDPDAVGWHVGYWLGYGFGFAEAEEWPEVFRNATYEDRRGKWWNTS